MNRNHLLTKSYFDYLCRESQKPCLRISITQILKNPFYVGLNIIKRDFILVCSYFKCPLQFVYYTNVKRRKLYKREKISKYIHYTLSY